MLSSINYNVTFLFCRVCLVVSLRLKVSKRSATIKPTKYQNFPHRLSTMLQIQEHHHQHLFYLICPSYSTGHQQQLATTQNSSYLYLQQVTVTDCVTATSYVGLPASQPTTYSNTVMMFQFWYRPIHQRTQNKFGPFLTLPLSYILETINYPYSQNRTRH